MLSLRERVIILFAVAPDGFSATPRELRKKFNVPSRYSFSSLIWRLQQKQILTRTNGYLSAGPVLRQELGADE